MTGSQLKRVKENNRKMETPIPIVALSGLVNNKYFNSPEDPVEKRNIMAHKAVNAKKTYSNSISSSCVCVD